MFIGAKRTKSEWLLFIHADSILPQDWHISIRDFIKKSNQNDVGWFFLKFNKISLWANIISHWANIRSIVFKLPFGDQGLLINRKYYFQIEGHPDIPIMEDIALVRKINNKNLLPINNHIVTSFEKYHSQGVIMRCIKNLTCQVLYFLGVNTKHIFKIYN